MNIVLSLVAIALTSFGMFLLARSPFCEYSDTAFKFAVVGVTSFAVGAGMILVLVLE